MSVFNERCAAHNLLGCMHTDCLLAKHLLVDAVSVPATLTLKMPTKPAPAVKLSEVVVSVPATLTLKTAKVAQPAAIPSEIAKLDGVRIDYAADGSPIRARVPVCATCKNALKVCKDYEVCATPVAKTAVMWTVAEGVINRALDALKTNEKNAEEKWRAVQEEMAARRLNPTADGATVTPIAPGFEGFAAIATRAAEMGFLVHPVTPGTKFPPLLAGFQHKATSDLLQIAQWAQQFPLANAGAMATPGGHIFLDEDNVPRIQELYRERYGEDYPRTYTTESQAGHRQTAWLQTDASRALGNVTQGTTKELVMSVRQKNYYVMVAGSIHPDTKRPYRAVDDSPIIPIPDKLVEFIQWLKMERKKEIAIEKTAKEGTKMIATVDAPATQPAAVAALAAQAIVSDADEYSNAENDPPLLGADRTYGAGERNNILSRYAYRRWVMELADKDELREDVHAFNEQHCQPPLSDGEVNKLIAAKLGLKQQGSKCIREGVLEGVPKLTVESVAADAAAIAAYAAKQPLTGTTVEEQMGEIEARQAENPDAETPALDYRELLLVKSALAVARPSWIEKNVQTASQLSTAPVRWTIHELLLHGGVTVIAAAAGSFKSTLSLLMAKAMLTNTPFAHRDPCGESLRVVYVDAENPEPVVRERLAATGLLDADGKEIPGFKIWGGWVMDENASIPKVMDDPRLLEDAIRYPNTFYIFDSLSSFTNGDDENDNPAMAVHMREGKRLARISAGALIMHHTPKDGRTDWRGAMSIIDQSDHALAMERAKGEGNFVDISDIRVRACQPWEARYSVHFDQVHPDGRIGLYIHMDTIDSGVRGDKTPRDESAAGTPEVDFSKTETEILEQAAEYVRETREGWA